jgi:hypothetical protein
MYESVWELQDQLEAKGVSCGLVAPLLNVIPRMGADDQIAHLERLIGRMKDLLLRQIQSNVAAAAVQPAAASDSGSETVRGKEVYATSELPAGRQSSDSPGKPGKRKRPSESGKKPRKSSATTSASLALARRTITGVVQAELIDFIEFAVSYMLEQRPSDNDQIAPAIISAMFALILDNIGINELVENYGKPCKLFFTGGYIKLQDLRQSALSGSTAHALSMIGAGRPCYSSLSITQILEMQPELAPAVDFCVKHLNKNRKTKRAELVSAFRREGSLNSFVIGSLFATGRFSMDKLKKYAAGGDGDSGDDSIADEEDGDSDSDSSQAAAAEAGAGADALGAGTAAGPAAEGDKRVSIVNAEGEASIAHAEARAPAPAPSVDGSELANGNGGVCHHGNQPMDVSAQKSACSAEGQEAAGGVGELGAAADAAGAGADALEAGTAAGPAAEGDMRGPTAPDGGGGGGAGSIGALEVLEAYGSDEAKSRTSDNGGDVCFGEAEDGDAAGEAPGPAAGADKQVPSRSGRAETNRPHPEGGSGAEQPDSGGESGALAGSAERSSSPAHCSSVVAVGGAVGAAGAPGSAGGRGASSKGTSADNSGGRSRSKRPVRDPPNFTDDSDPDSDDVWKDRPHWERPPKDPNQRSLKVGTKHLWLEEENSTQLT